MPIEGTENLSTTSDATDKNTATNTTDTNTQTETKEAADTQTATKTEAQEKTFTQAQVDKIVQNRIASGIKAELKKLTGDSETGVTLESLQTELTTLRTENQTLQARTAVRDYLGDATNQLNVPAGNVAAIEELVHARLEYSDGKPSNIKEAVTAVKGIAPALFASHSTNFNAGEGRTAATGPVNMNDFIRKQANAKNGIAA